MDTFSLVGNPFALMIEPEVVFAALERSDGLGRLHSTICRPLDKPRMERPANEQGAYDAAVETEDFGMTPSQLADIADVADVAGVDLYSDDLRIG